MYLRRGMMGAILGMANNKMISGTFNYDSTKKGTAQTINLNYYGNGWPVAFMIYPVEGANNSSGDMYNLIENQATLCIYGVKWYQTGQYATPTWDSEDIDFNAFFCVSRRKNSNTDPTVYGTSTASALTLDENGTPSTNTFAYTVIFNDPKTMKIYLADSSVGFSTGIDYAYYIIYS